MSLQKPTRLQKLAMEKRSAKLARVNADAEVQPAFGRWKACIGCFSGIRPWNQGSDYCDRCLRRDQR